MKWWVGVLKPYKNPRIGIVFPYSGKVTEKKFKTLFGYVFGGYDSKKEAVDVSDYQGFATQVKTYKQVLENINYRKVMEWEFEKYKRYDF